MEPPPDPPVLDYATPREASDPGPDPWTTEYSAPETKPVVGILGFLLYGSMFLLFSVAEAVLARDIFRRPGSADEWLFPALIWTSIWAFTLWRAAAALRATMEPRRKI